MLRTIAKRCHHPDLIKVNCQKCIFYKTEEHDTTKIIYSKCTKFKEEWGLKKPTYNYASLVRKYKCINGKFFTEKDLIIKS